MRETEEIFKNILILLQTNKIESNNTYFTEDNSQCCALCLEKIVNSKSLINFSAKFYHNTCINFWLNFVDESNFPDLKV